MSTDRSSSAVRNLRSLFENKTPDNSSLDTRGRSPSHLTEPSPSRGTSKVRASFVSVERERMATAGAEEGVGSGMADMKRSSSAGLRRGSFSENDGESEGLLQLKKTVSEEAERRLKDSKVSEAIPEDAAVSAHATPDVEASTNGDEQHVEDSPLAPKREQDQPPANPDKPNTSAEEEPGQMKPADMTSEAAVSGGEALPPAVEDLRPESLSAEQQGEEAKATEDDVPAAKEVESAAKPSPGSAKEAGKHTSSATKAPAKPAPAPKSTSSSTKPSQLAKKASRSSLSAPTAASVARAAGQDRTASTSSTKSAHPPMPKRDATKPIDLPSRLTAPTAASRARHELISTSSSAQSTSNLKASTATRPKTATAKPTPRTSLARPESRSSHTSKKPTTSAPADGSFLERMMRPTAASSSKVHDKTEVKSPPRGSKTAALKSKLNEHAAKKQEPSNVNANANTRSAHQQNGEHAPNGDAGGNETPVGTNGETNSALEATPAFGQDTIR
ncbi:hypothetical protein LTR62_003277 [Meristemomyces frigidus]|uniref:Uncharacterized protein n=1 Tax=Meristemomyces frigidus TaxID=1508187 RepID=A0AAN7TIW5_9PEZI|nr:hypothetical protein LTR62_003277 [Meristemomyces frigidus]